MKTIEAAPGFFHLHTPGTFDMASKWPAPKILFFSFN
jgi:hypothetical protein